MSAETRELAKNPERLNELRHKLYELCYGKWRPYLQSDQIEIFRQEIRRLVLEDLFLFDYLVLSLSPEGTCRDIEYKIHYPGTLAVGKEVADREFLDILAEIKEASEGAFDYSPNIAEGTPLGLVAIEYPTGFYKTSAFKRGGALWLYLRNPEERQLIARETASLAFQDLEFLIQQIETNEVFRWLFREFIPRSIPKRWSKKAFDLPRQGAYGEPSFLALGVGGAIRGLHFSTIWLDDIHGERAIKSQVVMQQTIDWALSISTRLISEINRRDELSGIFPKIRITQNRASQWDVHSAFEEAYGSQFVFVRYKALNSRRESVFVKKYSTEELLRKLDSENPTERFIMWTQFMNSPQESELSEFKQEWLKLFELEMRGDKFFIEDPASPQSPISLDNCFVLGWVDLATAKEGKRGSQSAIVILAIAPTGKKYLIEAWRKKVNQVELVSKIIAFHDIYKFDLFCIENYAEQSEFEGWLRKETKTQGKELTTQCVTPTSGKWTRIPQLAYYFKSGELRIRRGLREFMVEYENYPHLETCDILDALSACIPLFRQYQPPRTSLRAIHQPIFNKTTGV